MDLIAKQAWTASSGAGGLTALYLPLPPSYSVMYVECSTLATTNSFFFQSAQESSGPWFNELSTVVAVNTSTRLGMRVTGPIGPYVRPFIGTGSSGVYRFEFIGVG